VSFALETREGWLWPKSDTELWKVAQDYTVLELAWHHCGEDRRRVAIQAGGACGTFPRWLGDNFEAVYTFEPDPENFFCLVKNCPSPNVIKMQAGLGMNAATSAIACPENNCGAGYLTKRGTLPIVALDQIYSGPVDLIQLDVEGFETYALAGAEILIRANSPIIVVEDKGHHERYGVISPVATLARMGYSQIGEYGRDKIFKRAA